MENENINTDISFWKHKLENYLKKSNPSIYLRFMANDALESFLTEKATSAETAYHASIISGASEESAKEIGNAILFKGIEFSRTEHLEYIFMEFFPEEYNAIDPKQLPTLLHLMATNFGYAYDTKITEDLSMDEVDQRIIPLTKQFIFQYRETYFTSK